MKKLSTIVAAAGAAAILTIVSALPASAATITGSIPATATPGSTVTVTATVTAEAAGDIPVFFEAFGSGTEAATLSVTTTPAMTCAPQGATAPDSGVSCTWVGATVGATLTVTGSVTIPSAAAVGETFDIAVRTTAPDTALTPLEGTITIEAAPVVDPPVTQPVPLPTAVPAGTAEAHSSTPVWTYAAAAGAIILLLGAGTASILTARTRRRD